MTLFGEQFARGPLRNPVSAILGGISAGTQLIGGIMGSNAASSAAKMQQEAAAKAGQQVTDAVNKVNPDILAAADKAGAGVTAAAGTAGAGVTSAADTGATSVSDAATKAASGVSDAATGANKLLDPYATAGATAADVLNKGIAPGGDFNKAPTMADLQIDPGYQFRQQQAQQALERSAAAHGAVGGGGFQKDLNNYIQGSASQEYQNAFNRFETSTQNRFSNVNAVSNAGQAAAGSQGSNLIGAAKYGGDITTDASKFGAGLRTNAAQYAGDTGINAAKYAGDTGIHATDETSQNTIGGAKTSADYLTQGANAAAAGKVASTNALWGGISGAAGTAAQTYAAAKMMQNSPANYISPWDMSGASTPAPYVRPRPY